MARAGQLEGPWSIWRQAVKFPAADWDGRALFLGYSLVLKVWPKKDLYLQFVSFGQLLIRLMETRGISAHGE